MRKYKAKGPYDLVRIPKGKTNGVEVRHIERKAMWTTTTANARCGFLGGQESRELKFGDRTVWHELGEGNRGVWMSDLPCEVEQMKQCVADFEGDVLVGGLGLGVVVAILRHNPRVKSITVVEKSAEIIELVAPFTDAVVVQADLFDYLRGQDMRAPVMFDWAFFDIWQQDSEKTFFDVVVPLRELARENEVARNVRCWNEDVMRGQLSMGLVSRYHMTRPPFAEQLNVSMDMLCDPSSIKDASRKYIEWSAPFFRWVRDTKPNEPTFDRARMMYAGMYGLMGTEEVMEHVRDAE
jgi:hypothetical protein